METREIKFRAWEENHKSMIQDIGILQSNYRSQCVTGSNGISFRWNCPNVILMQYTGLKDKNGTEIYEGDTIAFEGIGKSNTVIFHDGCFGVDLFGINHGAELRHLNDSEKWEVIGNIHENPELLNTTT